MEVKWRIPTGSGSLDAQLGGGISRGAITLIYGEPGSGKTTIALSIASQLLQLDPAAWVTYVDSDGKFNPTRLVQMTGKEKSLERLSYIRPTTLEEQAEVLDRLPERLKPGDLVAIDSVTGLYRVETGDAQRTFAENKELNRQLGLIKETALTLGVGIVATGQVRSVLDSPVPAVEPVAQRLLRFWSDVVVKLENTATQGVKQATVEKPKILRGVVRFKISQNGIGDEEKWR